MEQEFGKSVRLTGVISAEHQLMKQYPYSLKTSDGCIYVLEVNHLRGLPLGNSYTIKGLLIDQDEISLIHNLSIEGWEKVWEEIEAPDSDPFS